MTGEDTDFHLVAGFSMSPLLRGGDRVYSCSIARGDISPGDIIIFSRDGKTIVHRVIRAGDGILTQGDANPQPDPPLAPETECRLALRFERDGISHPLKRGGEGLAEFRRSQRWSRRREALLKLARFLCRISPWKLRAENLEHADFDSLRVYYWRKRPAAWECDGKWFWSSPFFAFFIKRAHHRGLREKEQAEMRFGSILFRLLGLMVFGGARKYFSEQPPEMRDELCRRARMLALSPLFYYVLAEELSEKWRAVFKLDFYTASQRELKFSEAWKHVCGIFQSCGAPFVPLKGSSLAREVYPHPALRFRRDLDVLFHRADIERVFRKFRGDGWETHGRNHPFFTRLHLPTLVKPSFPALELHWHVLKNRTLFDPEQVWAHTVPDPENPLCRRLCPEAHYLLTLYNMYFDRWQFGCRSLLDLAFLQKKFPLDREKIMALNREWNLHLDPGLCYRLFPEMFPGEQRLFPSDAEISVEAGHAVFTLAMMDYPKAVVPFLGAAPDAPASSAPGKRIRRGLFRRRKTENPLRRKMEAKLDRLLPQATAFKQAYRRDKNK